jgi:predicted metal-dependent TIM-barrel fold hydrolase
MPMIDPHIHMTYRTADDYRAMAAAGIVAVVEPACWTGQIPSIEDYFLGLLGRERFRANQSGIRHYCALGLDPEEANHPGLACGIIELLHRYLAEDGVLAVGEIGYEEINPTEEKYFAEQLELAKRFDLPALVHTPERDKKRGTERSLALVREIGLPEKRVLIDHNTEETLSMVLDSGCWAGHSICPSTRMDEIRMVALVRRYGAERIIISSAADRDAGDPLKVPKTAAAMRDAGISEQVVTTISWDNPIAFFGQSGRLGREDLEQPLAMYQRAGRASEGTFPR